MDFITIIKPPEQAIQEAKPSYLPELIGLLERLKANTNGIERSAEWMT